MNESGDLVVLLICHSSSLVFGLVLVLVLFVVSVDGTHKILQVLIVLFVCGCLSGLFLPFSPAFLSEGVGRPSPRRTAASTSWSFVPAGSALANANAFATRSTARPRGTTNTPDSSRCFKCKPCNPFPSWSPATLRAPSGHHPKARHKLISQR